MAQQTEADDVSTELKNAVNSAKGTALSYGSSAPHAKQAEDGRWFVRFSTSHTYGRSNAVDAMQQVVPGIEMAYNPHGAKQWAAERVPEDERPTLEQAEALVQEGLEYVSPRGYHVRITGVRATGSLDVEYPSSQFGDSRTEPREGRLAELLASGVCSVLERPVCTDGGVDVAQQAESVNPHQHTSVWVAATNLERHEDGSAPRIGVEYRKKNGSGTARKAGTVESVEVEQPSSEWTHEVEQPTPRIVFRRDDGQRMYVEPDGLYTVGSHAPYVGSVVSLTTSTTSTVDLPEGSTGGEREADTSEDSEGSSQRLAVPALDDEGGEQESRGDAYVAALAEWAERHGLHARTGSTHYSWDLPGFGRQNDPHSGRCATSWDGEKVYVTLEGERSEAVERVLAQVAHRDDLAVSAGHRRVTLVPAAGV